MALQTATNPQTGERLALIADKWQPISQTATNKEGVKAYLVGNSWHVDEGATPEAAPAPVDNRPDWAKENPRAYEVAQTVRKYAGPAVEAATSVAGGVLGAPAGPAGVVGGSALGYGIGKEITNLADIALGNVCRMVFFGTDAFGIGADGETANNADNLFYDLNWPIPSLAGIGTDANPVIDLSMPIARLASNQWGVAIYAPTGSPLIGMTVDIARYGRL